MANTPRKRKTEDALWEQHRPFLEELFVTEGKTTQQVMKIMAAAPLSFVRSKEQFERVKRKYGFHKNIKKEDWRYIESVVRQRGANGKVSVVIVHGKRISEERLHRGIQRHSYEPVYERAKRSRLQSIRTGNQSSYLVIRSPSPHPPVPTETKNVVGEPSSENQNLFFSNLPCVLFFKYIDSMVTAPRVTSVAQDPFLEELFDFEAYESSFSFFIIPHNASSPTALSEAAKESLMGNSIVSRALILSLADMIPPGLNGTLRINTKDLQNPSHHSSRLEFFKIIIYLYSNNIQGMGLAKINYHPRPSDYSVRLKVLDIVRHHHNLEILSSLLHNRHSTARLFAKRLLMDAVSAGDVGLCKQLFRLRIHTDSDHYLDGMRHCLEFNLHPSHESSKNSLLSSYSEILLILLHENIDKNTVFSCAVFPSVYESRLVTELLNSGVEPHTNEDLRIYTMSLFRTAIRRNDIANVQLILSKWDSLAARNKVYRGNPSNFHIAAQHSSLDMIELVVRRVPPPKGEEGKLFGEALVAAALSPRVDTKEKAHYFLRLGADVNATFNTTEISASLSMRAITALQAATVRNNTQLTEIILERGALPNRVPQELVDEGVVSALEAAACYGNLRIVKRLVDLGANVNARSSYPWRMTISLNGKNMTKWHRGTVLTAAVSSGCIDIVRIILSARARLEGLEAALAAAVTQRQYEIAHILIIKGANISRALVKVIEDVENPGVAVYEAVLYLIERGADFCNGEALFAAVVGGERDVPVLRLLLGKDNCNSYPKIQSAAAAQSHVSHKFTKAQILKALHLATCSANLVPESLRILLEYNALHHSPTSKTPDTALICYFPNVLRRVYSLPEAIQITQNFISAGADGRIDVFLDDLPFHTQGCNTLLQLACQTNHKLAMFLLKNGISPNSPACRSTVHTMAFRNTPKTALQSAVEIGRSELIEALLRAGAGVNDPPGFGGKTALQYAAAGGQITVVRRLLRAGARVNDPAEHWRGRTALQSAVEGNHKSIVSELLRVGADVNAKPAMSRGATALQFAAANGNFAIAQTLIENGAEVNALPAMVAGFTALEGAALYGHIDMVQYLLGAGADVAGRDNPQYRRAVGFAYRKGFTEIAELIRQNKERICAATECQPLEEILTASDVERWNNDSYWKGYWGLCYPWEIDSEELDEVYFADDELGSSEGSAGDKDDYLFEKETALRNGGGGEDWRKMQASAEW